MGYIILFGVFAFIVIIIIRAKVIRQQMIRENESVEMGHRNALAKGNFDVQKYIGTNSAKMYIDASAAKIALWGGSKPLTVYEYSQIGGCEVYENGSSILSSRAGSAVVGGLLFGSLGAVAGASGSRTAEEVIRQLDVRVKINDIMNPEYILPIIVTDVNKTSDEYRRCIDVAKEMAATIDYIVRNRESA